MGGETFATYEKDTSDLLEELRVAVGNKMGLSIYEIFVLRAGYGIAYTSVINRRPKSEEVFVEKYYETLREAVLGELSKMGAIDKARMEMGSSPVVKVSGNKRVGVNTETIGGVQV